VSSTPAIAETVSVGKPIATETPTEGTATPTVKVQFWVDRDETHLDSGGCTNVHWITSDVTAVFYQNQPVKPTGDQKECFGAPRQYDLVLRVVFRDSTEQKVTISIQVSKSANTGSSTTSQPPPPPPGKTIVILPPPGITILPPPAPPPTTGITVVPNPSPHPIVQRMITPSSQALYYSISPPSFNLLCGDDCN
jgi:hypothetical protein